MIKTLLLSALLVVVVPVSGQAALVTIAFEADILSVPVGFGGVITTSDVISGTLVYSDNAPSEVDIPLAYNYTVGTFSGSSTIGRFFSSDAQYRPFVSNFVAAHDLVGDTINGLAPLAFSIGVLPGLPGESTSTVVPLTVPSLTTSTNAFVEFVYGPSTGSSSLQTQLTRLEVVQTVPIPSAFLLMGTGLLGLVGWRRWSNKSE